MVFTCPICYRQYKTESAYETHCFICKSQHKNPTTTMDDFHDMPSQAFMMKMMMEMSSKITSLEAKLFNVLTTQHKITENHNSYTKRETLTILNKQEVEDVETTMERECENYNDWFSKLNIKTSDVNIILNKKMLKGLSSIIQTFLKRDDSPIKKIGDSIYYYNNNKWKLFEDEEINAFIMSIQQLLLKKFNSIYNKRYPINQENPLRKTTMSISDEMKYLEQVKIMTDNSIHPNQIASIILK